MSREKSGSDLIMRGRGPTVWLTYYLIFLALVAWALSAGVAVKLLESEFRRATFLVAVVLAGVVGSIAAIRVHRSGIHETSSGLMLKTPFTTYDLGGESVTSFVIQEVGGNWQPERVVVAELSDGTLVTFPYISWQNRRRLFHYGTGSKMVLSKRQAHTLGILNSHVQHVSTRP